MNTCPVSGHQPAYRAARRRPVSATPLGGPSPTVTTPPPPADRPIISVPPEDSAIRHAIFKPRPVEPGFGSGDVLRGPAINAQVTFTDGQYTVTMIVSCDAGAPTATSTAVSSWGSAANTWGDDGE